MSIDRIEFKSRTKQYVAMYIVSIYLEDRAMYTFKNRISISLGGNAIGVSKDFFELLISRYFSYDLRNDYCKLIDSIEIHCFPSSTVRELK